MNLKSVKNITLDFYNKKIINIVAKQFDKLSRYILVTCTDQGNTVFLDKNKITAYIRYRKADELAVFNKCAITDDGEILVELTEQMLAVSGNCLADLIVIDNDELSAAPDINADGDVIQIPQSAIISTMLFRVTVIPTPFDNSEIESSYEFGALNDLLVKAEQDYTYVIEETKKSQRAAEESATKSKESEVNSKHYYELTRNISASIAGALKPMGTVAFENLPEISEAISGDMYNISNNFITTDLFKEGAGHAYTVGTNVYKTTDGYWDCLAGITMQAGYDEEDEMLIFSFDSMHKDGGN